MVGGAAKAADGTANAVDVRFTSKVKEYVKTDINTNGFPKTGLVDTYGAQHTVLDTVANTLSVLDLTDGKIYTTAPNSDHHVNAADIANAIFGNEATTEAHKLRFFWVEKIEDSVDGKKAAYQITINSDTFPATYQFVGDTFFTPEKGSQKIPYQWIIYKGKINSEVTFTMEAEGDPATFSFTVNALRNGDGKLMEWIQYRFDDTANDEDDEG